MFPKERCRSGKEEKPIGPLTLPSTACVNDCAERNIGLIQDFVGGYNEKDMKQKLMLVARDNRKKLQKELSKSQLKI